MKLKNFVLEENLENHREELECQRSARQCAANCEDLHVTLLNSVLGKNLGDLF